MTPTTAISASSSARAKAMPFTISHVAAVLPLNRKPLIFPALVIGSMSPDLLYFVPFVPNVHLTHTLMGVVVLCLPLSLVTLLLFYAVVAQPLSELLPGLKFLQPAGPFEFRPASRFLWIVSSILLGALTHIVWDSFTHIRGVAHFPWLGITVLELSGRPLYLYKLLQYLGGVLGLLTLGVWAVLRWRR